MERDPKDITADPSLREKFVQQESWDEYVKRRIGEVEEEDPGLAQEVRDNKDHPVYRFWHNAWMKELSPDTQTIEVLYLKGYTDRSQRIPAVGQIHAALREAAIEKGIFTRKELQGTAEVADEDLVNRLNNILEEGQEE